jgi:hypothetical protein
MDKKLCQIDWNPQQAGARIMFAVPYFCNLVLQKKKCRRSINTGT